VILVLAWSIIVLVAVGLLLLLYIWFIKDPESFFAMMVAPIFCAIVAAFAWAIHTVTQ
jgi:hypothetical protein